MLLLDYLLRKFPMAKRTTLRRMVEQGRVHINGQRARSLKMPLAESDTVRVDPRPRKVASLAPLELIHEDADILVINKPAGLLSSTTARERRPTAISIIRRYLAEREPRAQAGVIHRLDRDASGLMVFSKNHAAYLNLKKQFLRHTVERHYTVVVRGRVQPARGTIECRLVELPDGTVRVAARPGKARVAVSDYHTIACAGHMTLLRVSLRTGRKHQIRAQLAHLGNPVIGDALYDPQAEPQSRLLLAATRLVFMHPRTGQRLAFEIPPPQEIVRAFELAQEPQKA